MGFQNSLRLDNHLQWLCIMGLNLTEDLKITVEIKKKKRNVLFCKIRINVIIKTKKEKNNLDMRRNIFDD
jgi:hypothetical protein